MSDQGLSTGGINRVNPPEHELINPEEQRFVEGGIGNVAGKPVRQVPSPPPPPPRSIFSLFGFGTHVQPNSTKHFSSKRKISAVSYGSEEDDSKDESEEDLRIFHTVEGASSSDSEEGHNDPDIEFSTKGKKTDNVFQEMPDGVLPDNFNVSQEMMAPTRGEVLPANTREIISHSEHQSQVAQAQEISVAREHQVALQQEQASQLQIRNIDALLLKDEAALEEFNFNIR